MKYNFWNDVLPVAQTWLLGVHNMSHNCETCSVCGYETCDESVPLREMVFPFGSFDAICSKCVDDNEV